LVLAVGLPQSVYLFLRDLHGLHLAATICFFLASILPKRVQFFALKSLEIRGRGGEEFSLAGMSARILLHI
jgi:hypothetical protein